MWDEVSGGLQPQPWHHNDIWVSPYPNFPKFGPHLHRYNSETVHPYAHSQHMKVLKHFMHIEYGCGMKSVVVYSLNHDTRTSFGHRLTSISQNLAPTCTDRTVKWCTHMPLHRIWNFSITLYTSNIDVGCSQWWFNSLTAIRVLVGSKNSPP